MQNSFQLYVGTEGKVYSITEWDEGGANLEVFDSSGSLYPIPTESGTGSWGRHSGKAVCGDGAYAYQAMRQDSNSSSGGMNSFGGAAYPSSGDTWNVIHRYTISTGQSAAWSGGAGFDGAMLIVNTNGQQVVGLAYRDQELYVADPTDNKIKVYDASTMATTLIRSWSVTEPGQLYFDGEGYLWMLQPVNKRLVRYNTSGALQPQQISLTSAIIPTGFGVDRVNHKLYIANDGVDQNVLIYSDITGSPTASGAFGARGGIFSGTAGQTGPLRFNQPTGVGIDNSGNIYIASNRGSAGGGFALEKYDSAGSLQWVKYGLTFVDNVDVDPSSETNVYSVEERYSMDYSQTAPGTEWTYAGYTFNPFKYPDDPRAHVAYSSTWVRRISGQKFLFLTDMYGGSVAIYRFNSATDGEIAIPSGLITKEIWGSGYPPSHPTDQAFIWRDADGDGQCASDEYISYPVDNQYGMGWSVSQNGDIWHGCRQGGIRQFSCDGLDAVGNPVYTVSVKSPLPSGIADIKRIEYDSVSGRMFLGGFSSEYPDSGDTWWAMGRVICQYDNWDTGNRAPTRVYVLPWWDPTRGLAAKSMCIAGPYLFVVKSRECEVVVYDTGTGAEAGQILPTADTGSVSGWCDLVNSIRAYQRDNGEYLIFVEEDGWAKVMMYRWKELR